MHGRHESSAGRDFFHPPINVMNWRLILIAWVSAMATALAAQGPSPIPIDSLEKDLKLNDIPIGLAPRPASQNALKPEHVALGRQLFFDPILSADNTVACASCHRPEHGFASPEGRPRGIGGREVSRRAPTLLNRAYGKAFFWDGRAAALEEQALEPIANPNEMGSSVADALKRLQANESYRTQFAAAFDDGLTPANLGKSLASFERVLLRGDSPVDRFRFRGVHDGMTPSERHGFWLYESSGQCWRCHSGLNFSDEGFHNTGVGWGQSDLGRFAVTLKESDRGRFKTPTLRGVKLTAPYMHNGSMKTLEEVVEFYNNGGRANPHLDPAIRPLGLSKDDLRDLVAFLKSL